MQVSNTDRLNELIVERYEVVRNLLSLTEAHASAACKQDLTVTMSILSRKDSLIDRLGQLQKDFELYRCQPPESRVWRDDFVRLETQRMADQSDEILRKILELDGQTLRSMQDNRDAIAAQLHHESDSMSAQRAYGSEQLLTESVLDISDL